MDDSRFDDLARTLASPSRRTILQRLAGSAFGGLFFLALGDAPVDAHNALRACKKKSGKARKKCIKKAKTHNATHTVAPPTDGGNGSTPPIDPCAGVECIDQSPESCGTNGVCSEGVCQKYPVGIPCRAASCTSGVQTFPASCDGDGNCPQIEQQTCPNGNCNVSGTACGPCGSDFHCGNGRWCNAGTCQVKGANGAGCPTANACLSNFCVRGICCNHPCVGNHASVIGTCPNGSCLLTCDSAWGDCDGNLNNGCETSLRTTENCGACENNCTEICIGGGTCGFSGACLCREP